MSQKYKILSYCIVAIISLALVINFDTPAKDSNVLQTSVLTMLKKVNEIIPGIIDPDLSIENVHLRKVMDPTDTFHYYKYTATIVLHNYGGAIKNSELILHAGANQKYTFIRNTDGGFTLGPDKTYIVNDYELLLDSKYNGGTLALKIELRSMDDSDLENNTSLIEVSEGPSKLKNIRLKNVSDNGEIVLDFDNHELNLENHKMETFVGDTLVTDYEDLKYLEFYQDGEIYGYYRIANSPKRMEGDWVRNYEINKYDHYIYLKATDNETGDFVISDILYLSEQDSMTRAEFAKLFVEYTGVEIDVKGINYYDDIEDDSWYQPYIQTLYNLGLTDNERFKFNPSKIIKRAEVLPYVLDYYDVDLKISEGAPHYKDVDDKNSYYDYAESLYTSGLADVLRGYLNPNLNATRDYLKYLIYECRKTN